jgi:uncharacterized integral membrane protein
MNLLKSILRITHTIITTALLLCLVIFMVNNRGSATIQLYPLPFEIETRIFVVMIGFFLLGMIFGILVCSQSMLKRAFEHFKARRKIKKLEKQIIKN